MPSISIILANCLGHNRKWRFSWSISPRWWNVTFGVWAVWCKLALDSWRKPIIKDLSSRKMNISPKMSDILRPVLSSWIQLLVDSLRKLDFMHCRVLNPASDYANTIFVLYLSEGTYSIELVFTFRLSKKVLFDRTWNHRVWFQGRRDPPFKGTLYTIKQYNDKDKGWRIIAQYVTTTTNSPELPNPPRERLHSILGYFQSVAMTRWENPPT